MRTPLYDEHIALGARVIDFEGWQMPVYYEGILPEHRHTRTAVSLFDTCHMSEFHVRGRNARRALARALACRVRGLDIGQCRYGFLLAPDGGVLDDLICYRLDETEFMIVANAGTRQSDASVLGERLSDGVVFEDRSDETAKLDLQGPGAADVLRSYLGLDLRWLAYFRLASVSVERSQIIVSRTGYTGELGFELYVPNEKARNLWRRLLKSRNVKPAGLGARHTLRLEMGMPLYGHELSPSVTPVEAGLERFLPPGGYVGAEAVEARRRSGPRRRLVGITLDGRRAGRTGDAVYCNERRAGEVTSGAFAPSLRCAVAMAYVTPDCAAEGTEVQIEVRSNRLPGTVTNLPFYRRGTARTKLEQENRT